MEPSAEELLLAARDAIAALDRRCVASGREVHEKDLVRLEELAGEVSACLAAMAVRRRKVRIVPMSPARKEEEKKKPVAINVEDEGDDCETASEGDVLDDEGADVATGPGTPKKRKRVGGEAVSTKVSRLVERVEAEFGGTSSKLPPMLDSLCFAGHHILILMLTARDTKDRHFRILMQLTNAIEVSLTAEAIRALSNANVRSLLLCVTDFLIDRLEKGGWTPVPSSAAFRIAVGWITASNRLPPKIADILGRRAKTLSELLKTRKLMDRSPPAEPVLTTTPLSNIAAWERHARKHVVGLPAFLVRLLYASRIVKMIQQSKPTGRYELLLTELLQLRKLLPSFAEQQPCYAYKGLVASVVVFFLQGVERGEASMSEAQRNELTALLSDIQVQAPAVNAWFEQAQRILVDTMYLHL